MPGANVDTDDDRDKRDGVVEAWAVISRLWVDPNEYKYNQGDDEGW